jgi:hypothetical protein
MNDPALRSGLFHKNMFGNLPFADKEETGAEALCTVDETAGPAKSLPRVSIIRTK